VPTFFVPLENTRMEKTTSAKLIEWTDLQWEFFFTCWKYNHGVLARWEQVELEVSLAYLSTTAFRQENFSATVLNTRCCDLPECRID